MINDHKSMAGLKPDEQARKALAHILDQIRDRPFVGFYLGYGTESFSLATEALASLDGTTPLAVREAYEPKEPKNPEQGQARVCNGHAEITEIEHANLLAAVTELEIAANTDHLAACTNREHRTYALLQTGARKDEIAAGLWSLAQRLGGGKGGAGA
ncbi:MAG: hypothetical protein H7067_03760 [Burkholderiales bacterium]|nr:hypothetical protein [Opitutaceae bacterium]